MRAVAVVSMVMLGGCISVADMSAQQLRATNGMAMCAQVTSLYGRGSTITVNADDVRKGAYAKGKTAIQCGDSTMVIEHDLGVSK